MLRDLFMVQPPLGPPPWAERVVFLAKIDTNGVVVGKSVVVRRVILASGLRG